MLALDLAALIGLRVVRISTLDEKHGGPLLILDFEDGSSLVTEGGAVSRAEPERGKPVPSGTWSVGFRADNLK
jgi:hypothetical protein